MGRIEKIIVRVIEYGGVGDATESEVQYCLNQGLITKGLTPVTIPAKAESGWIPDSVNDGAGERYFPTDKGRELLAQRCS